MTAHKSSHSLALHAIEGTPYFIFGVEPYELAHADMLTGVARQWGAAYEPCEGGGCFIAHADAIVGHADYVGSLLCDVSNALAVA